MLGIILIVFLLFAVVGVFPTWGHSRNYGYFPSGIGGGLLLVVVILLLMGRI